MLHILLGRLLRVNKHNKRFKTDSQRVAFLPCVDFSDLGGVRKRRYCVAHHLSGRYGSKE
nr:DUF3265 domain-containing protein [Vibrio parahaemolyticus]